MRCRCLFKIFYQNISIKICYLYLSPSGSSRKQRYMIIEIFSLSLATFDRFKIHCFLFQQSCFLSFSCFKKQNKKMNLIWTLINLNYAFWRKSKITLVIEVHDSFLEIYLHFVTRLQIQQTLQPINFQLVRI